VTLTLTRWPSYTNLTRIDIPDVQVWTSFLKPFESYYLTDRTCDHATSWVVSESVNDNNSNYYKQLCVMVLWEQSITVDVVVSEWYSSCRRCVTEATLLMSSSVWVILVVSSLCDRSNAVDVVVSVSDTRRVVVVWPKQRCRCRRQCEWCSSCRRCVTEATLSMSSLVSDTHRVVVVWLIAAICRQHVFHLTFPQHWNAGNIHQLFSPHGMLIDRSLCSSCGTAHSA